MPTYPVFVPHPDDEGFGLIKASLRDYAALDLSEFGLPSVTELLPNGAASILDEGFFTEQTETPALMITTIGDGQTAEVRENTLCRFVIYAIDRGRGLYRIERVLNRLRRRLNKTDLALNFFIYPQDTGLRLENIEASGSTGSASLPAWKAEARGIYVFATVKGLESDFWSN